MQPCGQAAEQKLLLVWEKPMSYEGAGSQKACERMLKLSGQI